MRILLLVVALLSIGCSRRDPHTLVVWSWDIAAQALQTQVPDFEAGHPGIHVQVLDLGNGAVFERGMAGCAAGGVNLPDVYTVENSKAEVFWTRFPEAFVDLGPLGAAGMRSDYPAFKWTELTVGPRIFALPWDAGPVVMFYRRDLYRAAAVDPERIATWDDFLVAGQEMLKTHVRMLTAANGLDDDLFRMLANQNGTFYFSADGATVTINSPGCVRALELIKKMADAGILGFGGWTEQIEALKASTTAGSLYGGWYEGTIRTNLPEQSGQWGVYLMPAQSPGGPRAANIGGSALAIPASSHHQQLAWEFIHQALSAPGQVAMLKQYGLVPTSLGARSDPFVSEPQPFWGGQPIWSLILGTLDQVRPARGTESFQESRQIMATLQADYLAGRYPSAQACLDAAAQQISETSGLPVASR